MIEKLKAYEETSSGYKHPENIIQDKINELVDAVNELQNRIDPPSVYQVMKDKDAIIGKHIGEKQRLQDELDLTREALDKGMEHITGLNNMIESWLKLIDSDLDQETKLRILKSAISTYVENKGGDNE